MAAKKIKILAILNDHKQHFFWVTLSLLTICLYVLWPSWGSLQAMATIQIKEDSDFLNFRRNIQKHFLSYDVYLPLEDIVILEKSAAAQERLSFLMLNNCGPAKIYIWVPLKLKLPFVGLKTTEICWKPTLANR